MLTPVGGTETPRNRTVRYAEGYAESGNGDVFLGGVEPAAPRLTEFLELMKKGGSSVQPSPSRPTPKTESVQSVADRSEDKPFVEQTFTSELGNKTMYLRFDRSPGPDYDFRVQVADGFVDGQGCLPVDSNFYRSMIVGLLDKDDPDKMRLRLGSAYLKTRIGGSAEGFDWVEYLGASPDHPEVDVQVKRTGNQMEFSIPKGWLYDEEGAIPEDLLFRAPL